MTTLKKLLSEGNVSPLAALMSRSDVFDILGPCDGHYEYGISRAEKRGMFQFIFQHERLLKVDWVLGDNGTSAFEVTENCLNTTTTLTDFIRYCDENEVPWRIEQELSFDRQLAIRTCRSVIVIFDLDQRELQRISVTLE
jgi:hypothetical protein